MLRSICVALCLFLYGCPSRSNLANPETAASPPAPLAAGLSEKGWFTYFAPDGSFSLQFPKAPEESQGGQQRMLVHGLDKSGSNLGLIMMPLPEKFQLESALAAPDKFFANKNLKVSKSEKLEVQGHPALDLHMEAAGNHMWLRLIEAKPWLYQLVALQAATSNADFSAERQQFLASFQFTLKKQP